MKSVLNFPYLLNGFFPYLIPTRFSIVANLEVPLRIIHDLSNLKLYGKDGATILEHTAHFLEFSLITIFTMRILLACCSFSHSKHALRNGATHFQLLLFTLLNILSMISTLPLIGMIINLFIRK